MPTNTFAASSASWGDRVPVGLSSIRAGGQAGGGSGVANTKTRTSHLFELINLLRAGRPVTAQYLARELGISERGVDRDIETLRSL